MIFDDADYNEAMAAIQSGDPTEALARARGEAMRGRLVYVTYGANAWIVTNEQPPETQSHWLLVPSGECYAHIGEVGATAYVYEKSNR